MDARDTSEGRDRALSYAYRILARRDYPVATIRERLGRRGHSSEEIEGAVARLQELGLVDDEAFARRYVEHVLGRRPRGRMKVVHEMVARGIDRSLAERVVGEMMDGATERELARRALVGRNVSGMDLRADRRLAAKSYRFLKGRGFPDSVIRRAMAEIDSPDPLSFS